MILSNKEKIDYITNNFHQYIDLTLNRNVTSPEVVNLVIPFEDIGEDKIKSKYNYSHDMNLDELNDISIYPNSEMNYDILCYCSRVIDGDTFNIRIPSVDNNGKIVYTKDSVRLSGVNAPEIGIKGADVSKKYLEKICYTPEYEQLLISKNYNEDDITNEELRNIPTKKIYIKKDNVGSRDKYNRLLGVLLVDNKNINSVLLKEGVAEIWYVPPSEFNPYEWGDENTSIHGDVISDDTSIISPYLNYDVTNVIFTPKNDYKTIYRYEVYKKVFYVKMQPFSKEIRMHILPKQYDCSDSVLIFKDNMLNTRTLSLSQNYKHYPERGNINSYFQFNNADRDRDNPDISNNSWNFNQWGRNTFADFTYDISQNTKNFNSLLICAGYRYNKSTPFFSVHYTGVKDKTNTEIEDRCTVIDANYDEISSKTNNITQFKYNQQNELLFPKDDMTKDVKYADIDHLDNIGKLYHKKVKYINDLLYSEENREYGTKKWVDLSKE